MHWSFERDSVPNYRQHSLLFSRLAVAAVCSWAALVGATRPAQAQDVDEFGPVETKDHRVSSSEQNVAFEVRFGPYLPSLPNVAGNNPAFGDELARDHRLLIGFEADWQAIRIPGVLSLGPGVGIAYTRLHNGGPKDKFEATLKVMPQWLEAVLRVDILQQRWSIPFVFTGKLGAARASWWSTNRPYGHSDKLSSSGSAQGMAWALGAMFDLGFLEPERAGHMDEISDVNHMYLFWEWYQFKLDDFGKGPNQLGDSTWTMGWAVDM